MPIIRLEQWNHRLLFYPERMLQVSDGVQFELHFVTFLGFHIPDRAYVSSSFLVNANSTVAFLFDFCCRAEIQIQKIFRDGNSLSGLKYRGLNTVFSDDQIVTFENATVSDSGVYKFEILVIVDYRDVFETFLFHPIDVKGRCLGKL